MSWMNMETQELFSFGGVGGPGGGGAGVEGVVVSVSEYDKQKQRLFPMMMQPPDHFVLIKMELEDGSQCSVIFEGHLVGVVGTGDRIIVKGANQGGNLRAYEIFNCETQSIVAKRGLF